MVDLTISIVTYNNERTIRQCIESIISFIHKKLTYELYIIDNHSLDNTLNIVKSISDDIRIIRNRKNIGFGAGHNKLLNNINSRYHIIVNPDIVIESDCIMEMTEFMDSNKEIGLLSPLIKSPNGEIQYLCKRNPTFIDLFIRLVFPHSFINRHNYFEMRETGYNTIFKIEYATGCFMFFRTEIFEKLNGFDEKFFLYLEDADITRRVNEISNTIFYPYNYVIHEWQRGTHKKIKLMLIDVKSAIYYFKKWGFKLY